MDDPNTPGATLDELRRENARLHTSLHQSNTRLAEASSQAELLRSSLKQTSDAAELLRAERKQLLEEQHRNLHEIAGLQHQLQALLRRYYGRSAEKIDPKQLLLFKELLTKLAPEVEQATEPAPDESPKKKRNGEKNGHGRRRFPSDLPRETVIHDLPEDEKRCPCCGKLRQVIGRETSEQLEYVPAKVKVIEHVRMKYGCPACEATASEAGPQIVTAEKPLSPIEKGLAAPGLLSYVIVSKYGDHLPLHRLEGILKRHGIEIARSTMCDWAAQCADLLRPLTDLMQRRVLQSKVIHTDDTPVKVRDRSLDRTRTGRFWVYLGDENHPYTVFAYTPSRSRDGPMKFLRDWGKDERVYLQADAFGGYDGIYAGDAGGCVTEAACWAHARRKFYDARHSDPATSTQALAYIRLLYDVEVRAKASVKKIGIDPVSQRHRWREEFTSTRYRLRQESAVPRLVQFQAWLESQQAEHGGPVLPKSPMGQAIRYALNQWEALCVYTADGRLAIDNNASENALRRVAIGRKNWLFAGSDKGGHTAATLFSLIATCQRHQVEPLSYLRDVLTRIAATPVSQLDQFLPNRWNAANSPAN